MCVVGVADGGDHGVVTWALMDVMVPCSVLGSSLSWLSGGVAVGLVVVVLYYWIFVGSIPVVVVVGSPVGVPVGIAFLGGSGFVGILGGIVMVLGETPVLAAGIGSSFSVLLMRPLCFDICLLHVLVFRRNHIVVVGDRQGLLWPVVPSIPVAPCGLV